MTSRMENLVAGAVLLAIIVVLAVLFGPRAHAQALSAQNYPCPAGVPSCKVITITPDEENSLNAIYEHAIWANRLGLAPVVDAWKQKLREAPQGKHTPAPQPAPQPAPPEKK